VDPVLCREVIEGEEHILVFHETVTGLLKLCPVEGKEGIIGNQGLFLCRRHRDVVDLFLGFGHLIQDVHGLMDPAALFLCVGV